MSVDPRGAPTGGTSDNIFDKGKYAKKASLLEPPGLKLLRLEKKAAADAAAHKGPQISPTDILNAGLGLVGTNTTLIGYAAKHPVARLQEKGPFKPTTVIDGQVVHGAAGFPWPGKSALGKKVAEEVVPEVAPKILPRAVPATTPRVPKGKTTTATGGLLGADVREGLQGAGKVRAQQNKLYSEERAKRISEAERLMNEVGGEEGHRLALKALSGELPKLEFTGFSDLSRDNIPELFQHIQGHPALRPWERVRTRNALLGVFDGRVPTPSELRLLGTAFGKEDAAKLAKSASLWKRLGNTGLQLLNVPRALKSSFDLSAPFRQGLVLGARHPVIFAREFRPMVKAFKSERAYDDIMNEIASRPTFKTMQDAKLALTDLENISNREEAFASNLAEYVPGVRPSGRAYVAFLNKFRADAFDNYLRIAATGGRDISDPHLLDSIAKWVNYATGRGGSNKTFVQHAVGLNAIFFSPRLIASRLNLLFNPVYYAKLDPFARKQALRGMGQLIGGISLTLWMAKLAGAQVGLDPRSADFGKIKVGNTRVDVMGGFQQYIVAADRLIKGESVSSTTGEVVHLTGGFGKSSRGTLLARLAQQKFAPVPAYGWGLLNNENFAGQSFNPAKEAGLLFAPLGPQNAVDTYRQEGVGPALAGLGLGSIGFGVQTYGPKPPKKTGSFGRNVFDSPSKSKSSGNIFDK